MRRANLIVLALLAVSVWPGAARGQQSRQLSTGELVLQRARDHALRLQGQQQAEDVDEVRILLEAAARIDDDLVKARVWIYELAALTGDTEGAKEMLAEVLRTDPEHETAFVGWLETGLARRQTTEARTNWLQEVAQAERPDFLQAHVRTAQARLALAGLDLDKAREYVAQAQALAPHSLGVRYAAVELLDAEASAAQRLATFAELLEVSPRNVEAAWQVAAILAQHGLSDQAKVFFDYAQRVHRKANPGAPLPGEFLLDHAFHLLARGERSAAIEQVKAAIGTPHTAAQAAMLLYTLLEEDRDGAGEMLKTELGRRFARVRDPARHPVNEVAQAAWFHVTIDPQPERALMLARNAARQVPNDVFTQRVLGWAYLANLEHEQARRTLAPIADSDAWAAAALARLHIQAERNDAARQVLAALDPWPTAGPALDVLEKIRASLGEEVRPRTDEPPAARYPEIVAALNDFDARVLRFVDAPGEYLEAEIVLPDRSYAVGEPWWSTFRLTNRGPFPITLGAAGMVNPSFVVSYAVEGDRPRRYPGLMSVSLERRLLLEPGQSLSERIVLDVGPLAAVARNTPQMLQRVAVSALLDPMQDSDGTWHEGPFGLVVGTVHFNRMPISTAEPVLNALYDSLDEPSLAVRGRACVVLAALLGEQQRAAAQRLEYRPDPVSTRRLSAALYGALVANSWEQRVWALDALQAAGLTRRLVGAVEDCLTHRHWLVRLMAVRVLARQGERFADRARQIAARDADELVQGLAEVYLRRWGVAPKPEPAPTTAPAAAEDE